ncbi:MAG TPA: MFS transporter [Solirubrobacteraceae bacterium]|jgi:MFS family permease|nr:MFS transporter [Solirubrobacteraceae bacterium]
MNALITALRSRRAASGSSAHGHERPIVRLVRALLLFESAMYSAVTPVLPHYAHTLHASKPAVGVLTAAYPAGIVPGSLLGAWIAARAGVRRTTLVGLLLFAVAIVAFGFGTDIVVLDALRFVQGTGCGLIWGGGLTWVIAVAPRARRGAVLGSVIGAAIFGTLLGPILGTLAVTLGTAPVFTLVGVASFGLAAWTLRQPEPAPGWDERRSGTPLRTLAGTPRILLGAWLILLEAATIGATATLIPLRLAHFGASGVVVGATFLIASLISTQIATPIGRLVDSRGAGLPLCVGLTMTAVLMALLPLPHSALALAIVSTIALGGPLTAYTIPAMSIITEASERVGVSLVMATMLLNLAWALGETLGAPAAANISQATSDAVPLLLLSGIMVLTLLPVIKARLFATGAEHPAAPAPAHAPDRTPDQHRTPDHHGAPEQAPASTR